MSGRPLQLDDRQMAAPLDKRDGELDDCALLGAQRGHLAETRSARTRTGGALLAEAIWIAFPAWREMIAPANGPSHGTDAARA